MESHAPSPDVALLLSRLERDVVERQAEALAVEGATVQEWRVLDCLHAGGRTMSSLAEWVGMPGPSLTKLVDRLVNNNLVHRKVGPDDRRKVRAFLTTRGRNLHVRLAATVERAWSEAAAELPDAGLLEAALRANAPMLPEESNEQPGKPA